MEYIFIIATAIGLIIPTHTVAAEVKPVIALEASYVPTVITTIALDAPQAPPVSIETRIREKAREYGVDEELALRIIKCESNFNRYADNPTSSADSYWQFLDSTWKSTMSRMGKPTTTSKFDEELSIEAGIWLLKEDGSGHWLESKFCWDK